MKRQSRRVSPHKDMKVLPEKDTKESPKKLSEFEKLVGVCKAAIQLYYQQPSDGNKNGSVPCSVFDQVGPVIEKSLRKKPVQEDGGLFFKDKILVSSTTCISRKEVFKGSNTNMVESPSYGNNLDSIRCSDNAKPIQEDSALVFKDKILVSSTTCISREEVFKGSNTNMGESPSYGNNVDSIRCSDNAKSCGKKPIQEDGALVFKDKILVGSTSCISREELFKGSKTNMGEFSGRNNIDFSQFGKINAKSCGKKPIQEDGALFFRNKNLVGSTSCISLEELFKGSKTNMGESSSGKLKTNIDHDCLGVKKVVNWNDNNGYFLNNKSNQFVEEKMLDGMRERKRSRKCFDSSEDDQDFEEYSKKNKKPRNTCNARQKVATVTSPLPVEMKNEIQEMGGTDIKLIIQKNLFSTDTAGGQNRFSIPMKQIREKFLTDEEESILDQRFKDMHVVPLMVPLIEPNLEKTQINFRKWDSNSSYVLSSPWNAIRDRNALKPKMEMQLWSFRVDGALNLALVKVTDGI